MTRLVPACLLTLPLLFAQGVPRAEYPQPQFQREQWLTLNGTWEFEFDDQNVGLAEHWAAGEKRFTRSIVVPFAFETALSGIGDTSFHPWVWYRRPFTVPAGWKGKRVLLHFGAVDYRAQVWVNGRQAGEHESGHVPFCFDITHLLKEGSNVLAVRAEDPPTDRTIPRGKQYWEPKSAGIFYTRTSGIWQPVWLEAAGESYLSRVRITPATDGAVRFEAAITNPRSGLEFAARIRWAGEEISGATAKAGGPFATLLANVDAPRLWHPDSPNLYDVTFELRRGDVVVDRVQSYFGFRSVSAEGERILLNGRPIYLKTVLDQGYWPESTLTPPSDDAIQYDIRMTKEMGFNGARKHQKVEDPRFLYWADKLGLLVSGEMPNAHPRVFTNDYVTRFVREWMEAIERDYNHPSIIIWAPLNESWGVPNLRESRQVNHMRALYTLTKSMDATRLVVDNDGWEHADLYDIFNIHDYARHGDLLLEKYKGLTLGEPSTHFPSGSRAQLLPGFDYNGAPVFLSEFGGIAYILPGQKVPESAWGYAGVEKSQQDAMLRLRSLYTALERLPAIVGICYTQLTDVEQEINGLLTYDRKPKFDAKALRELNNMLR